MSELKYEFEGEKLGTQVKFAEPVAPTVQLGSMFTQIGGAQPLAVQSTTPSALFAESGLTFTPEEQQNVIDFSKKIDISDPSVISSYGVSAQGKISEFSSTFLSTVKTKDVGETGALISQLVGEINTYDGSLEPKKGFARFITAAKRDANAMAASYKTVEANIEAIKQKLEKSSLLLSKDIVTLEKLYQENLLYYRALTQYIIAGKLKIEEEKNSLIPLYQSIADKGGLYDAQKLKDLQDQIGRFEKKIYNLELTRQVAIQNAGQIRILQNADSTEIDQIQSTTSNAIPLWKTKMVIAVGMEHAKEAAAAETAVTDLVNRLLVSNAEQLKQTSVAIAKESERGIIDIDTMRKCNQLLIASINETMAVHTEGAKKRAQAEKDIVANEKELKQTLLNAVSCIQSSSTMQAVYDATPSEDEDRSLKLHL